MTIAPGDVLTPSEAAVLACLMRSPGEGVPTGPGRSGVLAKGKVRFIQRLESRELPRGGEEEAG